jgi:hypothetical protein
VIHWVIVAVNIGVSSRLSKEATAVLSIDTMPFCLDGRDRVADDSKPNNGTSDSQADEDGRVDAIAAVAVLLIAVGAFVYILSTL